VKSIPKVIRFSFILASAVLVLSCHPNSLTLTKVTRAPVATRQLDPAVFVSQRNLDKLGLKEGAPVFVKANGRKVELRIYKYFRDDSSCGMHKKYLKQLEIGYGNQAVTVEKAGRNATLNPVPIQQKIESCPGDTNQWPGMVLGTPHADCDNETGAIAKIVNREAHIPCVSAWKYRLSYRGIWYDVNRPLMKLPLKNGHGTQRVRVENDSSLAVYHRYLAGVRKAAQIGNRAPLSFYFDLHGHDLTVKLPDGRRVYRNVVEAVGAGFAMDELRRIKQVYNRYWQREMGDKYPRIYFGNLPEDLVYDYEGVPVHIFYTALGTRTYGILQNDQVIRGLHMETPDTLRLTPGMRLKTAHFIEKLFTFVRDSLPDQRFSKTLVRTKSVHFRKNRLVSVPAGSFIMGAPDKMGWACSRPRHSVYLDSYAIDRCEVTNAEFAAFLNQALKEKKIFVQNGVVHTSIHPSQIICRLKSNRPFSQIVYDGGLFRPVKGREWFPVIYVSWYGASLFAESQGKRLPTEAEWEKAAGAASSSKTFLFGYRENAVDWKKENCENSGDPFEKGLYPWTTPVGFYSSSSPFGVYDMSGNVWEWCSDYFEYAYYSRKMPGGWKNPKGPGSGTLKSIRGGAWNTEFPFTTTYFRLGVAPNSTLVNLGFRCAK